MGELSSRDRDIDFATSRSQIEELLAEWARRVDLEGGRGVEDLFVTDGAFAMAGERVIGRSAIRGVYERRRALGPRTARHLMLNVAVSLHDEANATARSVMVLFADDGEPPLPISPPLVVQDVVDECVRTAAGEWCLASRLMTPIFEDGRAVRLPLRAVDDGLAQEASGR